jgi:flotillin
VTAVAEAEQSRLTREGDGRAAAVKAAGLAEAEAIKAAGLAEAEAIKAKGQAEALVKERLAEAYEKYGQQAVIDRLLQSMPEMLAAAAKPLSDVDNITVIGDAGSASGLTKLSTDMLVNLPAIIKAATGLDVSDLMKKWFDDQDSEPVKVIDQPVTRTAVADSSPKITKKD